jgi:hypothetical protein
MLVLARRPSPNTAHGSAVNSHDESAQRAARHSVPLRGQPGARGRSPPLRRAAIARRSIAAHGFELLRQEWGDEATRAKALPELGVADELVKIARVRPGASPQLPGLR